MTSALAGDPQVDAGAEEFRTGSDHLAEPMCSATRFIRSDPTPAVGCQLDLGDGLERDEESAPGE